MRDPDKYSHLAQALDHFEGWLNYWAGISDKRPRKPRWMDSTDATRVRDTTQRIVRMA